MPTSVTTPPGGRDSRQLPRTQIAEPVGGPAGSVLLPATVAERYELGAEIARGGMGAVLEAADRGLRRQVAMKVMLNQAGAPDERVLRFVSEARVTGQLEHPSIVPVYELGTDPRGRVFYSMKLVRGTTLSAILTRIREDDPEAVAKYSLNALLTVFLKVCDAMAFAHSRGVVHRDLKPDNIMVGEFGEVLVMDWGLAKVLGAEEEEVPGAAGTAEAEEPGAGQGAATQKPSGIDTGRDEILPGGDVPVGTLEGQILGTPAFMAPEQARGTISAIDARTDIYALGAILYSLLVLRSPVEGGSAWEILAKVVQGRVTPPATHNRTAARASRGTGSGTDNRTPEPDGVDAATAPSFPHCPGGRIPEPLSQVTMKALAVAPSDRYQTVPELQADIEAWRGGFATAAEAAGLWRQVSLLIRRHRIVASASLAVVLSLAVGLAAALVQWRRAVASEGRARLSEREARENEGRALTAEAQRREMSLAAAKRFAMQAIRSAETGYWDEAERRVQDAESVSPDGPWGAYARGMFATARKDYATAAERFREARQLDPDHAESTAGLADVLSRGGEVDEAVALAAKAVDVTDWRALFKAGQALYENDRLRECQAPLERALGLMEKEKDAGKGQRVVAAEEIREMVDTARAKVACEGFREEIENLPPEEQIKRVQAKLSEINGVSIKIVNVKIQNGELVEGDLCHPAVRFLYPLEGLPLRRLGCGHTQVRDLSPLKGMPLTRLDILVTKVSDLGPLRGMPLTSLRFAQTQVSDLSPLRGMPLTTLECGSTMVSDISPLRGMPLKVFGCGGTPVSDLSPLQDMSLETLDCRSTRVTDLSPLRGMPLASLALRGAPVSDLTPLAGMALESLWFQPKAIKQGTDVLRAMKSLRRINVSSSPTGGLKPEDFWKRYDAGEFR